MEKVGTQKRHERLPDTMMIYGEWNTLRSTEKMGAVGLSRKPDTVGITHTAVFDVFSSVVSSSSLG